MLTSAETERRLDRVLAELAPDALGDRTAKWRVLRLGLAVSLRSPVNPLWVPEGRSGSRAGGAEYRLTQVTGEGKKGDALEEADLTDALRAMLGVLHERDLFAPEHREGLFASLLEFHIERGLEELVRVWEEEHELGLALVRLLAPPGQALVQAVGELAAEQIVRAFLEQGVVVRNTQPAQPGPRLTHVPLYVPDATDYDRIVGGLNTLAFTLGLPQDSLSLDTGDGAGGSTGEAKTLTLLVPRPRETWQSPGYAALRAELGRVPAGLRLPLALGVNTRGQPLVLDLGQAPHVLIGGSTGSGKSVVLHGILCGLLLHSGEPLRLHLCDAKGTELGDYQGAPKVARVATRVEDIVEVVGGLVQTMDERFRELGARGLRDIVQAREQKLDWPCELLVLDELTDLLMQAPRAEADLVRLAQKGRGAGIHLILATQRPDAKTLPGNLRSNVPARVALAVQKATESTIILDERGAESLMPPGDMLVRWPGRPVQRAHGYLIRPEDLRHVLRAAQGARS